jgi:hypothetical protein
MESPFRQFENQGKTIPIFVDQRNHSGMRRSLASMVGSIDSEVEAGS